ncbi:hypothetical protein [Arthrobacter sp. Soil763]|uniref:hypothetical protein n=1 Tax=Arthrobacter sp. Soil763 TaxID=1736402 RepID=UPI0006FFB406|nr:hypothetical protein [Arthrobacter sp. Soil763]KRE77528.1 hypothetical protein ASG71_14645 [Arthrobacter sp. Soil763]
MEQILTERTEVEEVAGSDKHYVARFGSFILRLGPEDTSPEDVHAALVSALGADNRVTVVDKGSANHEWTSQSTFYPSTPKTQPDELLSGASHFHTMRFSDAIMFEVHVPGKNQPVIHGEVPEIDSYFVAWDGCTAVVMWEPESRDGLTSPATGQVAVEILRRACVTSGQSLYVQACSPACQHLFAHREFKVDFWSGEDFDTGFSVEDVRDISLTVKGPFEGGLDVVEAVHDEIKMPAAEFAELKNTARRILDIESSARSMSFELIGHDYETLKRSQEGLYRRLRYFLGDAWMAVRGKGRVRRANLLIASLWLAMANMETLQQVFRDIDRGYQESISRWAVPELFATDLKSEEAEVASLDPHFARAAIEHKTKRMDNRVVVWATIAGAGMGAAVTAVVGGLSAAPK